MNTGEQGTSKEMEGLSGIFISEHDMNNMRMERIVVSNPAILAILKVTQLPEAKQEEAVAQLVDRTAEWMELEPEVQMERIKAVLTQETIIEYLVEKEYITAKCDMVNTGIDVEGSVVIEAYYVKLSREQRRAFKKASTDEEREKMAAAVNILGQENIVDLAQKKIEKMREKKVRKVVPLHKGKRS